MKILRKVIFKKVVSFVETDYPDCFRHWTCDLTPPVTINTLAQAQSKGGDQEGDQKIKG
jgi:hypothetical protein